MKTCLLPVVLVVLASAGATFGQVPSTDIFVFSVDGSRLGEAQRVTDREGYDNQPRFLRGGNELVYSSLRDGQTDIYRHDLRTDETTRIVATAESEYSPTPIPGTRSISLVRITRPGRPAERHDLLHR